MQYRHRFISFYGAVLTNISPEHIESHGGFEAYRTAKTKLFERVRPSGFSVLNREDPSSAIIAGRVRSSVGWYSRREISTPEKNVPVSSVHADARGAAVTLDSLQITIPMGGEFMAANVLAAAATVMAFGVALEAVASAAREFHVPGRMEYIQSKPFSVVVDYAVTPDALEKVYSTLGSRLICVFGSAGGGRDRWKRPELGRVAAAHCRSIIVTSDDPDDEDPEVIAEEIIQGIPSDARRNATVILDRREAIRAGLTEAKPGETVILTGMGAQPWLVTDHGKIPWDERAVAREELSKIHG